VLAIACPCVGGFGLLTVFGLGIESGYFPDTKVVPGEKLSERTLRFLRERDLLGEEEQVIRFYSAGMFDVESDGSFFTDARVVRYFEDLEDLGDGKLVSQSAEYDVIASIETEFADGWMADSTIRVTKEDGEEIELVVCNDEQGDREFAKRLQEEWERRRGPR
jgi:hypothetical protein